MHADDRHVVAATLCERDGYLRMFVETKQLNVQSSTHKPRGRCKLKTTICQNAVFMMESTLVLLNQGFLETKNPDTPSSVFISSLRQSYRIVLALYPFPSCLMGHRHHLLAVWLELPNLWFNQKPASNYSLPEKAAFNQGRISDNPCLVKNNQ